MKPGPGQIWWHKYKHYHVRIVAACDVDVRIQKVERFESGKFSMWLQPRHCPTRTMRIDVLLDRCRFLELEERMPDSAAAIKTTAADNVAPE
jgi:hypothetical protein